MKLNRRYEEVRALKVRDTTQTRKELQTRRFLRASMIVVAVLEQKFEKYTYIGLCGCTRIACDRLVEL